MITLGRLRATDCSVSGACPPPPVGHLCPAPSVRAVTRSCCLPPRIATSAYPAPRTRRTRLSRTHHGALTYAEVSPASPSHRPSQAFAQKLPPLGRGQPVRWSTGAADD